MAISAWNDQNTAFGSIGNRYRTGTNSRILYIVILSAILIAFGLMPFIPIQISINSHGIIQSALERTELLVSVGGRVVELRIKDNQSILKGDTILKIDSSLPTKQSKILSGRSELLRQLLDDVQRIGRHADQAEHQISGPKLFTEQYKASWLQFSQEFLERLLSRNQAERMLKRYNTLYEHAAITLSENEKFKFEYDKAVSEQILLIKRYKSQWELEASNYRRELSELLTRQAELQEQNKLFTLLAPVNGSVQNLAGIQAGSWVFANQKIAEISPDTQLIALCYLKPSDIGLVSKGQSVNFQIDAFNYNQWGLISGKVIDISDDIIFSDQGIALFKVRCLLDNNHLKLKNEYKGYLKKGMSFTARFMVSERTLYDLLYDNVDDWLNPNLSDRTPI